MSWFRQQRNSKGAIHNSFSLYLANDYGIFTLPGGPWVGMGIFEETARPVSHPHGAYGSREIPLGNENKS